MTAIDKKAAKGLFFIYEMLVFYYALIVRIDNDGEENVIHGYKGRYFKTSKSALKSTNNYINKKLGE